VPESTKPQVSAHVAALESVIAEQGVVIAEQAAVIAEQAAAIAEQAGVIAAQAAVIVELRALVESLRAEVAALRRQVGRDSTNSSLPPSQDGPASRARVKADAKAKAKAKAAERSGAKRAQGGQKGHQGTGLARVAVADKFQQLEPPACGSCGGDLVGAPGVIAAKVQVIDLPAPTVSVTEYTVMRRTCGCGHPTVADLPPGVPGGPVCYGPNIAATTSLLASCDVISVERSAELMSDLLGVKVSTGYVSSCLVRLDKALEKAKFEEVVKERLRAARVVGTDETPASLTSKATSVQGCGNPHVFTVRTMAAYTGGGSDVVWYGAAGNRTKKSISAFEILDGYRGVLVRDDYGGYHSYDEKLEGVQQCLAHLFRYLDDTHEIDKVAQVWARQVADVLRAAIKAVRTAREAGLTCIDADVLADLRTRYDQGVAVGISTNLSRLWRKDGENHPGLVLARRLYLKVDQVWLFTEHFDVPPTNNGSEHAVRGYKLAVKISGCWRTLKTLQRHCRIRSYLTTTRNHGVRTIDAVRDALSANPWMPPAPT
jgi:cell division protein FtsB